MAYIFDTNVYVDAHDQSAFADEAKAFVRRVRGQIALSSVVVAELWIGARDLTTVPRHVLGPIPPSALITPTHDDWELAGQSLRALGGHDVTPRRSFWNDLLLAANCARLGHTLVTSNVADFRRIARVIPLAAIAPWPDGR